MRTKAKTYLGADSGDGDHLFRSIVITESGDRDHAQGGYGRPLSVDLAPRAAGWACCGPNCRVGSRAGPGWRSFHGIHGKPRARRGVPPSSDAAARAGGTWGCGGDD